MPGYNHPTYDHILRLIREAIREGSLTQSQVAERLEITQAGVSKLLSGDSCLNTIQLLTLLDFLNLRGSDILKQAEMSAAPEITLSPEMQGVMYKSEVHTICYTLAVQEIEPSDVHLKNVSTPEIKKALEELLKVGLLVRKRRGYIQKYPNIAYTVDRLKASKIQMKILERTNARFDAAKQRGTRLSTFFNWFQLDRFTTRQAKEIESEFWRIFEKVSAIQRQNLNKSYVLDEPMPMYNIHMMILPGTDEGGRDE